MCSLRMTLILFGVTSEYQMPSGQMRRIGPCSQMRRQSALLLKTMPSGRLGFSRPSSFTIFFNSDQLSAPTAGSQHLAFVGVAQRSKWWLILGAFMPPLLSRRSHVWSLVSPVRERQSAPTDQRQVHLQAVDDSLNPFCVCRKLLQ